ncbi:MAG: MarR family winged helix-turn-helix transcriptional regulator [Actinomycetota bacterium]
MPVEQERNDVQSSESDTDDPRADQGHLARTAGEAVVRVAADLDRRLTRAAAPESLTATEVRFLRLAADPVPQSSLAALMGCDAPRISTLTRNLEARGLIVRVVSRGDHRVRRAELTPTGREVVARVGRRLADSSPLLGVLDDHELFDLADLLGRIESRAAELPVHELP